MQKNPASILSAHFGRYRDFGLYTDSLAFYGSRMFYYVWDVPIFCAMGAVGGLMGALWVHVNVRVTAFRHRCIPVRCVPVQALQGLQACSPMGFLEKGPMCFQGVSKV